MRTQSAWKILTSISLIFGFIILLLSATVYLTTYQPDQIEDITVHCSDEAKPFPTHKPLKVLSYNVQFFAGKDYVFYFDVKDNTGPDTAPSPQAIQTTLLGIAQIIQQTRPDIILLQEVHDGANATGHQDQLSELLALMPNHPYACHASAFYWQADYVPHPKIMGSVGMKLSTLSRYKLNSAQRHQLALQPMDPISQQFYLKRAILEATLETSDNEPWHILNTHFDAFAKGSNTMEQQVNYSHALLSQLDTKDKKWIFAGDLNLLPPDQYIELANHQHYLYKEETELQHLFNNWPSIPNLDQLTGDEKSTWYTHLPNDPLVIQPDRSIDYIFHSEKLGVKSSSVMNTGKLLTLSDHMPIMVEFISR